MRALLVSLAVASAGLSLSPSVHAAPPAPSVSQQAVYKALSVRHPVPTCAAVAALSDQPAQDLSFVVEHAAQPAWAGMRAAECLLEAHPADARPLARRWVTSADSRGFALMALGMLDQLPRDLAIELAQVARRGPLAEAATPRIARSTVPEIAAIAAVPVAELPPLPADLAP